MSSFTPGPWHAIKASHGVVDVFDNDEHDIVTLFGCNREANARLIAAAPDLLFELEGLVHFADGFGVFSDNPAAVELRKWIEGARAAIAKATGEA